MKSFILFLMAGTLAIQALDVNPELYVMGKSYHTNREYGFNENNYGLGIGAYITDSEDPNLELTACALVYYDSYKEIAKVVVAGPRYVVFGNKEKTHVDFALQIGAINGSGSNGTAPIGIPTISVGYGRYNIHFLCIPQIGNVGSTAEKSTVFSAFLRIGLN